MSALLYVRISPWQLAALVGVAASLLSATASVEVRRRPAWPWPAMAAAIAADCTMLLVIPSISPALVTTISGTGMVAVIWLSAADNPPPAIKVAASIIALAVVIVALDLHFSGESMPSTPTAGQQAAFWATMGVAAVITAVATAHKTKAVPKVWLIVGKGLTSATNTALVYTIMRGGAAAFLPVLVCSALFDLYLLKESLTVNSIPRHLPIEFCVYQFAVWLSSPAVADMTYHGGAGSAVGTVIAAIGATMILVNAK